MVIVFGIYLLALPLLPEITLLYRSHSSKNSGAPYRGALAGNNVSKSEDKRSEPPADNRIVIPKTYVNAKVVEGATINAINNGNVWHRPNTKSPGENGNIVLAGHRYYGKGDTAFYHLDHLAKGDKLALYWHGKEYIYEVVENKIVPPEDTSIEKPSNEERLTLYTCTPLWTAKDRLVIIAKRVKDAS